jgi:hypothetical protein
MNHIYVIGAGGVGSWLVPSLCLLQNHTDLTVIDGDRLERKNLNRQLFTERDINRFKSDALAQKYGCLSEPKWFSHGMKHFDDSDWLISVVDNHPARMAALESSDAFGCKVIIAANEKTSAEAYYYQSDWKDSPLDPRVYYPEILTDKSDDPMRVAIGCTGEAQRENVQLVSANFMAAALAQHLFVVWKMEYPKLDKEVLPHLPYKLTQNLSNLIAHKVKG